MDPRPRRLWRLSAVFAALGLAALVVAAMREEMIAAECRAEPGWFCGLGSAILAEGAASLAPGSLVAAGLAALLAPLARRRGRIAAPAAALFGAAVLAALLAWRWAEGHVAACFDALDVSCMGPSLTLADRAFATTWVLAGAGVVVLLALARRGAAPEGA